jgi:hypothetical protein
MLKSRFVGRGMHLEFCHPEYLAPIITSPIEGIWECPQLPESVLNAQRRFIEETPDVRISN